MKQIKVAYIHGRPAGHPAHDLFAKQVNADFYFVDFYLRYHDVPNSRAIQRYLSWLICAFTFPNRKKYDVFLSEEPYFMLALMKRIGLITKKQKLFSLLGTHTPYFILKKRYGKFTLKMFKWCYNIYDGFFCEGNFERELLLKIIRQNSQAKIYTTFNGITSFRFQKLYETKASIQGFTILSIASIPNEDKIYYKGIDVMLKAFNEAKKVYKDLTYTIIGEYNEHDIEKIISDFSAETKQSIKMLGRVNNFEDFITDFSLYFHIARGEAWGISVTEAMLAGLPAIVSNETGSKEVVAKVDQNLIIPVNQKSAEQALLQYFSLSEDKREILSKKAKEVSSQYTEAAALKHFKNCFYDSVGK